MRNLIAEMSEVLSGASPEAIAKKLSAKQRKVLLVLRREPTMDTRHPSMGGLKTQEALFKLGLIGKAERTYPKGKDPQYVDPMDVRVPLTVIGRKVAEILSKF